MGIIGLKGRRDEACEFRSKGNEDRVSRQAGQCLMHGFLHLNLEGHFLSIFGIVTPRADIHSMNSIIHSTTRANLELKVLTPLAEQMVILQTSF